MNVTIYAIHRYTIGKFRCKIYSLHDNLVNKLPWSLLMFKHDQAMYCILWYHYMSLYVNYVHSYKLEGILMHDFDVVHLFETRQH